MTPNKHTPGPWHPGHLGSDGKCQCANVVDEGYAGGICTIHVGNGKPIGEGGNDAPPRDQAIANMHLIAAAPAMLEALVEAREQIAILQDRLGIKDTGHGTLSIIDAALTSIKGGSNA